MQALQILANALAAACALCWAYQLVYLAVSLIRPRKLPSAKEQLRYGILIAARNEEAVLPYLLESLRAQDYPADRLRVFVVADNCTDRTAEVAALGGATVWRRYDKTRVGKGYALSFLLEHMKHSGQMENLDAFLVFDADNLLCPDYISSMNRVAVRYPAFCGYRNTKNFADSWLSMGCGLWFLHDSLHLNSARMRLGVSCAVSGTGFGFTRELLEKMGGWNFFTLTEDIEFDNWCAVQGVPIGFCREAVLFDEQAVTVSQSWRQRTRWVQGGIQVSLRYGTSLLRGMCRAGKQGWICFETATLGLWGYLFSGTSVALLLLLAGLTGGAAGVLRAAAMALAGMYTGLFCTGLLTALQGWQEIRATTAQKLCAVAVFPLFMLSFAPIAAAAVLKKPGWAPIHHTAAIPISRLTSKK